MNKPSLPLGAALLAGALALEAPEARADEPAAPAAEPASSPAAPIAAPASSPAPAVATATAEDPGNIPAPAAVLAGTHREYRPLARFEPRGTLLQADFLLAGRAERATAFPVDRDGTRHNPGVTLAPMLRAGVRLDSGKLLAPFNVHGEYEHDLPTGFVAQQDGAEGQEMPGTQPIDHQLRKLYARVSLGPYLHVGGGFMTNQFGLGLLANDGAQSTWTPGSARFADNRGGDRVLRGFLGTGPLTSLGITATVAFDQVQGDDVMLEGDSALQAIGTASIGYGKPWGAGVFVVHRWQDTAAGERTEVTVVDLAARYAHVLDSVSLSVEGELAVVAGSTTLAPTPEFPVHDVLQIGGALRAAARFRGAGGVLDILYASGDGNPDDSTQTAFRADPNYEMGLLLYRHVLAAQTGRAPITAGDLGLVGVPSPGLERVPTRGSPTNTLAVFPRAYVRPVDGLEVYGGPLLAWTAAPLNDPLNTRTLGGGVPRNALGGDPGDFLGVELDLGARYRMLFWGTELTVGVEGAGFLPGNAFVGADGTTMGGVFGGRALVQYRL